MTFQMTKNESGHSRDRNLNLVNVSGLVLLSLIFLSSFWNVFSRAGEEITGHKKVIRFAHWRLEGPTIAGYADVEIQQMPIPLRIWPMWVRSRLTGRTSPDIVMYLSQFIDDILLVRHFIPLSGELKDPNPYNEGTPLEERPWRSTFLGDPTAHPIFNENLVENYALPTSSNSLRFFYNRDLFTKIVGPRARPPSNFRDFLDLAEKVEAYSERTGLAVVPVAGSKDRSSPALSRFLSGLTQTMLVKLDWNFDLSLSFSKGDPFFAYHEGRWSLNDSEIRSTFAAVRAFNMIQNRGYLQRMQDEATFQFLQGRALMAPVFSIDAENLIQLARFEIGVIGRMPLPASDDPEFGRGTLGEMAEAGSGGDLAFVISNQSKHPETALDFLRFLTSFEMNAKFCEVSNYLPAVEGVPLPKRQEAFAPIREGFPPGIPFFELPDLYSAFLTNLHILSARDGGVDAFIAALDREFEPAMRAGLYRSLNQQRFSVQRADSLIAAYGSLSGVPDVLRFQTLAVSQNQQENNIYRLLSVLD